MRDRERDRNYHLDGLVDYYNTTITIPLLDHLIYEITNKFATLHECASVAMQ